MKLKYITFQQFLDEVYEVEGIRLGLNRDDDRYIYPHYKDAYPKPLPKGSELDLLLERIRALGVDI